MLRLNCLYLRWGGPGLAGAGLIRERVIGDGAVARPEW